MQSMGSIRRKRYILSLSVISKECKSAVFGLHDFNITMTCQTVKSLQRRDVCSYSTL